MCVCTLVLLWENLQVAPKPKSQPHDLETQAAVKPAQWLTDPYSNRCSTPANKANPYFPSLKSSCRLEKNARRVALVSLAMIKLIAVLEKM